MKTISRNCDFCNEVYDAQVRYLNRGQGIYCSRKCSVKGSALKRVIQHEPNLTCAYCNVEFYRDPSKQTSSRSGLYFCCREHKDLSQKLGGIKEIQPAHYGSSDGKYDYRKRAMEFYGSFCCRCGYDKYPEVLEVNHIDCDRDNNELENLEVLCPTCHAEFHFTTKTGQWREKK